MISWEEFKELSDFSAHPMTDEELQYLCSEELLNWAKNMGKNGILFPHHLHIADVYELLYISETASKNEALFLNCKDIMGEMSKEEFCDLILHIKTLDLYKSHNYFYYYDLKERANRFFKMHSNFSKANFFNQCCTAFEKELFYPCVCGLFAILEGVLGDFTKSNVPNIKKLFQALIGKNKIKGPDLYVIANIQGFIELITESSNFLEKDHGCQFNRHWILHGRSNRNIEEFDCLKLFNAIDAVIDAIKIAGDAT